MTTYFNNPSNVVLLNTFVSHPAAARKLAGGLSPSPSETQAILKGIDWAAVGADAQRLRFLLSELCSISTHLI